MRDWEIRSPRQLIDRLLDRVLVGPAPQMAADLLNAVRVNRPDVAVCSFFALGGMVAAEAADLPYFVMMANTYCLPAPGMPPFGLGAQPASGPVTRIRDRAVNALVSRQWNRGREQFNGLRTAHGLRPLDDIWDQVRRAAKVLVLTSGRFDFPAQLPESVRYVGPVLDDPAWAADRQWSPPRGDDPLVLVAMSSTYQNHVDALQRCVHALASLSVRGLVTTGPVIDPSEVRGTPNVHIAAVAPHSEVLKHASAVVTHGGHGTVARTLAAGIPLVVLPHGRDQGENAARVTARGAGIALKQTADRSAIAAAVRRVIDDPTYRQAADRLGESLRSDAASGMLVAELEDTSAGGILR
jgi:MGT family glycosyltransferase